MAWSISHSPEAWDNVRENLGRWSQEKLIEAWAENAWQKTYEDPEIELEKSFAEADKVRDREKSRLRNASVDVLVEMLMIVIKENDTCTNGGHEFYVDQGGTFKVPVSLEVDA